MHAMQGRRMGLYMWFHAQWSERGWSGTDARTCVNVGVWVGTCSAHKWKHACCTTSRKSYLVNTVLFHAVRIWKGQTTEHHPRDLCSPPHPANMHTRTSTVHLWMWRQVSPPGCHIKSGSVNHPRCLDSFLSSVDRQYLHPCISAG